MSSNNRIVWVDIAKGIGIFLVVLGHLIDGQSFPGMYIWSFHMPLFFFLSGMFMLDTLSWLSVKKRARQLLLPCVIFTFISCLVQFFILGNSLGSLQHSLPVPLWFLTTLFLSDLWCRTLKGYMGVSCLILLNLVLCFVFQRFNKGTIYSLSSIFPASVFYLIGHQFNKYKLSLGREKSWVLLILVIVLIPLLVYLFDLHTDLDSNVITLTGFVVAMLGIIQIVVLSRYLIRSVVLNSVLSFLGCHSLAIMLTHFIYLQLYCHFIQVFTPVIVYKALQALFVFGMSISSIFLFRDKLAWMIGRNRYSQWKMLEKSR